MKHVKAIIKIAKRNVKVKKLKLAKVTTMKAATINMKLQNKFNVA
jgi:hypothetical protein